MVCCMRKKVYSGKWPTRLSILIQRTVIHHGPCEYAFAATGGGCGRLGGRFVQRSQYGMHSRRRSEADSAVTRRDWTVSVRAARSGVRSQAS